MQTLSVVGQLLPLLLLYLAVLFALAYPLGLYVSTLIGQPAAWMQRLDHSILPHCGVDLHQSMTWKQYLWAMVGFNLLGVCFLYALQLLQAVLPLNPMDAPAPTWHSALNTAVSFVTNTNWQGYAGETAVSYTTQMIGLTVQNFLSAATGMAVALVLIRALTQSRQRYVGNAWVDLWRINVYVLLPLSALLALLLIGQGVIQNFAAPVSVTTLEGAT
jgi:K+-transporting ATPase ATPase A chain